MSPTISSGNAQDMLWPGFGSAHSGQNERPLFSGLSEIQPEANRMPFLVESLISPLAEFKRG